jgi:hypothetical protein
MKERSENVSYRIRLGLRDISVPTASAQAEGQQQQANKGRHSQPRGHSSQLVRGVRGRSRPTHKLPRHLQPRRSAAFGQHLSRIRFEDPKRTCGHLIFRQRKRRQTDLQSVGLQEQSRLIHDRMAVWLVRIGRDTVVGMAMEMIRDSSDCRLNFAVEHGR